MANKLDELQQRINALQKERDELLASEKANAIEQANSIIRSFGLKVRELSFKNSGSRSSTRSYPKVVPKYSNKDGITWSGRGRKPKWVEDHLAKGGKLTDLLIK